MTTKRATFNGSTPISGDWLSNTRRRIEVQKIIVESLEPESTAHRLATQLLLLYQDSLHVLTESTELLGRLDREQKNA